MERRYLKFGDTTIYMLLVSWNGSRMVQVLSVAMMLHPWMVMMMRRMMSTVINNNNYHNNTKHISVL